MQNRANYPLKGSGSSARHTICGSGEDAQIGPRRRIRLATALRALRLAACD